MLPSTGRTTSRRLWPQVRRTPHAPTSIAECLHRMPSCRIGSSDAAVLPDSRAGLPVPQPKNGTGCTHCLNEFSTAAGCAGRRCAVPSTAESNSEGTQQLTRRAVCGVTGVPQCKCSGSWDRGHLTQMPRHDSEGLQAAVLGYVFNYQDSSGCAQLSRIACTFFLLVVMRLRSNRCTPVTS